MADLEVPVQADHGHRDEAPATKEEARPAVEPTALPAEQPAVGETGHNEKGLARHCKDGKRERWRQKGGKRKWKVSEKRVGGKRKRTGVRSKPERKRNGYLTTIHKHLNHPASVSCDSCSSSTQLHRSNIIFFSSIMLRVCKSP